MPELPEVETVRRGLMATIVPATITDVEVYWEKIITPPFSSEKFKQSLRKETIHTIERRGKYLIFLMDHWAMISHLRMEGKFVVKAKDAPLDKHTHVVFQLADGRTLRYLDVRKFGRMTLVPIHMIKDAIRLLKLGPEPVASCFRLQEFASQLTSIKRAIKPVLLEQKVVAGIGNIYADEILFRAKIMPTRASNSLTKSEVQELHKQILLVLDEAVKAGGSTIRTYKNSFGEAGFFQDYLKVYGKTNESCLECGHSIQKIKLAQRGTHYCPQCQK